MTGSSNVKSDLFLLCFYKETIMKNYKFFALAGLTGIALFTSIVIFLHIINPSFSLSARFISELALQPHGWLMLVAFNSLAAAFIFLHFAFRPAKPTAAFTVLLDIAAVGFIIGGIYTLDSGPFIHIFAVAIAFTAAVAAMIYEPYASSLPVSRREVSWPLATGMMLGIGLGLKPLPPGTGQRIAAVCITAWLTITAFRLYHIQCAATRR